MDRESVVLSAAADPRGVEYHDSFGMAFMSGTDTSGYGLQKDREIRTVRGKRMY